jgi:hypothetical protein
MSAALFWLTALGAFSVGLLLGAGCSGVRRERADNLAHEACGCEECQS